MKTALHVTNGNCSPPVRRFGLRKPAISLRLWLDNLRIYVIVEAQGALRLGYLFGSKSCGIRLGRRATYISNWRTYEHSD